MNDYIQVMTTTAAREDAEKIAQALLDARQAACVQILGPISSSYRWQGKVETSQEWLCLAKSRRGMYELIEATIRRLHPYEMPEILAIPIVAGSAGYLAWLDGELGSP
jgi:periplasmic divalent cation tolerance protein